MADYYTHLCFAFKANDDEVDLLDAITGIDWDDEAPLPEAVAAKFPNKDELRTAIFGEHDDLFHFGVDFHITGNEVWVTSDGGPNLDALANVIQLCCQDTLKQAPIGFEWSNDCSKHRPDAFGGGWCAIFHDRQEWENTATRLEMALRGELD